VEFYDNYKKYQDDKNKLAQEIMDLNKDQLTEEEVSKLEELLKNFVETEDYLLRREPRYKQIIEQTNAIGMFESEAKRMRKKRIPFKDEEFNRISQEKDKAQKEFLKKYEAYKKEMVKTDRDQRKIIQMYEDLQNNYNDLTEKYTAFNEIEAEMKKIENATIATYDLERQSLHAQVQDLMRTVFQPYEHNKEYNLYEKDVYKEIFNRFVKLREEFNDHRDKPPDLPWLNRAMNDVELLRKFIHNRKQPSRNIDEIEKDIKMRRDLFSTFIKKEEQKLKDQGIDPRNMSANIFSTFDHQLFNDLNASIDVVNADKTSEEVFNYLESKYPRDLTEGIEQLRNEFNSFRELIKQDRSAYAGSLSTMFDSIFSRFLSQVRNVTPEQRKEYVDILNIEKEHLRRMISKETYMKMGLTRASEAEDLQSFVMNPFAFQSAMEQGKIPFSKAGMSIRESRRLLTSMKQLMDLRKRMTSDVFREMNIEGDPDAPKYDMIVTHAFPPSQVEFKLRYLLQLPSAQRDKHTKGPFMMAIKQLLPEFDMKNITMDTFLTTVSQINQASKDFLQQKVMNTGVNWTDFENLANEFTRTEYGIMSQLDLAPIGQMDDDFNAMSNDPSSEPPPQDIDSYNPGRGSQLARDKRDDAKRQSYIAMIGSIASTSLQAPKEEAYVPMHPGPAKYFFTGTNYTSLQKQFESQRPLIPKTNVEDPLSVIENIITQYGPILGIRKPKTTPLDHPNLIQQEAIELNEFVAAFSSYTSKTEGEFQSTANDPMDVSEDNDAQPTDQQPDDPMQVDEEPIQTKKQENVDPLGIDEMVTDEYTSGYLNNRNDTSWIQNWN
jgi:hypothetical protein